MIIPDVHRIGADRGPARPGPLTSPALVLWAGLSRRQYVSTLQYVAFERSTHPEKLSVYELWINHFRTVSKWIDKKWDIWQSFWNGCRLSYVRKDFLQILMFLGFKLSNGLQFAPKREKLFSKYSLPEPSLEPTVEKDSLRLRDYSRRRRRVASYIHSANQTPLSDDS